jgi:hypothetical protein
MTSKKYELMYSSFVSFSVCLSVSSSEANINYHKYGLWKKPRILSFKGSKDNHSTKLGTILLRDLDTGTITVKFFLSRITVVDFILFMDLHPWSFVMSVSNPNRNIFDFWFWGFYTVCKVNMPTTFREPL